MTATASTRTSLEDIASRLDQTRSELDTLEPGVRRVAEEHLQALDEVHRDALRTIVRTLRDDPRGKELLFALVDDPVVHLALAMHGIVRPDPLTAAQGVLASVRPALQSHGGDVELVRVEDATAYVSLRGACNGCSMASVTMRTTIEEALLAGVPGLRRVEVVPREPEPAFVDLATVRRRPGAEVDLEQAGWVRAGAADDFTPGMVRGVTVPGTSGPLAAIVVHAAGTLTAFVDACAHLGRTLTDADVDSAAGTITCAGHGFCYDVTEGGECLSMPGATLESLPLRIEAGTVWVRARES